jgi:hypothetical protein
MRGADRYSFYDRSGALPSITGSTLSNSGIEGDSGLLHVASMIPIHPSLGHRACLSTPPQSPRPDTASLRRSKDAIDVPKQFHAIMLM